MHHKNHLTINNRVALCIGVQGKRGAQMQKNVHDNPRLVRGSVSVKFRIYSKSYNKYWSQKESCRQTQHGLT